MIVDAMFFQTEDNVQTPYRLQVGPITVSLHSLYVSFVGILIVFPVNLVIAHVFRKAKPRKPRSPKPDITSSVITNNEQISENNSTYDIPSGSLGGAKDTLNINTLYPPVTPVSFLENKSVVSTGHVTVAESGVRVPVECPPEINDLSQMDDNGEEDKRNWPSWTLYVGWTLVFLSITVSGFFLILYSMEWGKSKSEDWLVAFVLSFVESVIMLDPLKVTIEEWFGDVGIFEFFKD